MADQKTEDTKSPLPRRGARPFAGPAGAARPFLRPVTTPQRATAAPFVPPVVPGKPALGIPAPTVKAPTPVAAEVAPQPVAPNDVDAESRTRPVTSEMIALDAFDAFETVWGGTQETRHELQHDLQAAAASPLDESSLGSGTDGHQDWAEEIAAASDVVAGEFETPPAPAVEPMYSTPDGAIPGWLEDGGSTAPVMPTDTVMASARSAPVPETPDPIPAWPTAANDASYAITEWTDAHTIPPADDFQPAASEWSSDAPYAALPEPSLGEAPLEPAQEALPEAPQERPRFELVSQSQETEAFPEPLPDAMPDPRTTREMRYAAVLDRLANRIRSGEIDVSSIAPDAPDAAILASVLVALLGGSSSR